MIDVKSGMTSTDRTVENDRMRVSSGGLALRTTVEDGGTLTVYSSGRANSAMVNPGGVLFVTSGGTATLTKENGGYVDGSPKTKMTFADNCFCKLSLLSGSATVHSGTTANICTISSSGLLKIYSGGSANSVTVNPDGNLEVSCGGTAAEVSEKGGYVTVENGAEVSFTPGSFTGLSLTSGSATAHSGTTARKCTVNERGVLDIYSSGSAADVTVNSGGLLCIFNGGAATAVQENGGFVGADKYTAVAFTPNTISNLVLSSASATAHSGTTMNSVSVLAQGGLWVFQSGVINDLMVSSGGRCFIQGGKVVRPTVDFGGYMNISSGGTVTWVRENGGCVQVESGAEVSFFANNFSGLVLRCDSATVHSGTTATHNTVGSACLLEVFSGGIISGFLQTENGAVVSAHQGAIIDFTVSEQKSSDIPLIRDWSLIRGGNDAVYTLTVNIDQADGVYSLAKSAADFRTSVTLKTSEGTVLGTLDIGETKIFDETKYTFVKDSDHLTLSVSSFQQDRKNGSDLDGNSLADIVMSITESGHPAEGAAGAWLIQYDQTPVWGDLSTRSAGWEIFGTGYTKSGKSTADIYIRSTDNVIGAWTTGTDGKVTGWETVGTFDENTQILGLGDFNGDGQTDLLLRNVNGAVGCHFTGGSKTGWNYFQNLGDEWKISAIGDLNGDGIDDVVLKHDAGFAGSWLIQADGSMVWADLDTLPGGFEIAGCGDFNGDGIDDVLLKKDSYYGAWIVENGSAKSWMGLGNLGNVSVEQIADFNGDGKDDLRIRTSDGDLGAHLVMGEDSLLWRYYGSVGNEWSTSVAALQ